MHKPLILCFKNRFTTSNQPHIFDKQKNRSEADGKPNSLLHKHLFLSRQSMKVFTIIFAFFICLFSCQPSESVLLEQGNNLFEKGEYQKAIKLYTDIIDKNIGNELAIYNRGLAYYQLDSNIAALQDFNTILERKATGTQIEFNPTYASGNDRLKVSYLQALYQRGLVWENMDSLRKAFVDYKTCLDSETERMQKAKLCIRIGDIYQRASNMKEKGCEYYRQALLLGHEEANARLETYCQY
jgi:tetratricopeptide (TPR) repeat protein